MDKAAERQILAHFKTQVPELAGATVDDKAERPDFVCTLPNRTIGVELTEFYHGKAPKGSVSQAGYEAFQERVVAAAQPIFEANNNGMPLYVSVGFYDQVIAERPEALAQGIAETVTNNVPATPVTDPSSVIVRDRQLQAELQPWVATILMMRFARNNVRLWRRDVSGSQIEGDVAAITADIAAKEADIPNYRPANEYWLLIYASGRMLASTMMLSPMALVQTYSTTFDRVYVQDTAGQVLQLTTQPAVPTTTT